MNPRQIEAFRAVARIGAVTGAAEQLHISQPAVSRLIANLESRTGLELFARRKGRLRLTPEGEAFLREVDRHFKGLDALAEAAHRIAEHGPANLRILGFPSITNGVLPQAIARHLTRHPDVQISLDTDTTDRIAPQVAASQYDLGFAAGGAPEGLAVHARVIASRPWACVVPRGHALTGRDSIHAADLAGEALVGFSPSMSLRQAVDRLLADADVSPSYRVAAQTIESMCALVAEGCGIAVVHPYATHIAHVFGLGTTVIADADRLDLIALTSEPPFRPRIVDELIDDAAAILQAQRA